MSDVNLKMETKEIEFRILSYDKQCEDYNQIKKIKPVKYSCGKICLLVFLNLCTAFLIDLFLVWFPKLRLYLLYSECDIQEAREVYIVGTDDSYSFITLDYIDLPSIKGSSLKKYYKMNIPNTHKIIMFTFKLFKYVYQPDKNGFEGLSFEVDSSYSDIHKECGQGLTPSEVAHQKKIFGECDLIIEIKSFCILILEELLDPFFLFQVASIVLWMFDLYVYYSALVVIAVIISLVQGAYETRKNLKNLKRLAQYSCKVNVHRKNENGEEIISTISSTELVPGDVFELQDEDKAMPCDAILIEGSAIINEAMLTGESTPIIKSPLKNTSEKFDYEIEHKLFLFSGTTLIQKRPKKGKKVLALVHTIGFDTTKGNLIRSIIHPKNNDFKFKEESFKYIAFMACLSLCGFAIAIPFLIQVPDNTPGIIAKRGLNLITTAVPPVLPACLSIGVSFAVHRLKKYGIMCIDRNKMNLAGKVTMICFDKTGTLTEDHLDIYGYITPKIIIEENKKKLIFNPFQKDVFSNSKQAIQYYKDKILKNSEDPNEELNQYFVECLATCHGATLLNGKLIGDPIDVRMFESSNWNLFENVEGDNVTKSDIQKLAYVKPKEQFENENDQNTNYEIGIIRRFDFSSKLQRMSVITKDDHNDYYKVFCKGSPEIIKQLCVKSSVPPKFDSILNIYTSQGYRVLCMGFKRVNMNYIQSQNILREEVENNLIFIGFIIVQNKLKPETNPSIITLRNAGMRMVMATGDNIFTAIAVGKECDLIPKNSIVHSLEMKDNKIRLTTIDAQHFEERFKMKSDDEKNNIKNNGDSNLDDNQGENNQEGGIVSISTNIMNKGNDFSNYYPVDNYVQNRADIYAYTESDEFMDNDINQEDINQDNNINEESFYGNKSISQINDLFDDEDKENKEIKEKIIAIQGPVLERLCNFNNEYLKEKDQSLKLYHDIYKKVILNGYIFARMSPEHKALLVESIRAEKVTVLMCGDGANDCEALKTADIGISLSQEDASIAAPFTSKIQNISSVIELLREGKCSLMTSFQTFKFNMMNSMIQFISNTFLLTKGSYLSDYQFLLSDAIYTYPLTFFFPITGPYHKLTDDRPIEYLISFPIISSILTQTIITFAFQFFSWLYFKRVKGIYDTCEVIDNVTQACTLNTINYLISNMQYVVGVFIFSTSKPFKKRIYTNILLTIFMIICFAYGTEITLYPDPVSVDLLILMELSWDWKWIIYGIILFNFIFCTFIESIIIPFFIRLHEKNCFQRLLKKVNNPSYEPNLSEILTIKRKTLKQSGNPVQTFSIK